MATHSGNAGLSLGLFAGIIGRAMQSTRSSRIYY